MRPSLSSFAKDDAIELLGLRLSTMEFLKQHRIRTARALIDLPWTLYPAAVAAELREHVSAQDYEAARAREVDGLLEALRARASPAYLQLPHRDAVETLPEDKLQEALLRLREGLELGKRGGHAERLHTIVGLVGPDAPEVAAVLADPKSANLDRVLDALLNRPRQLPALPLDERFVGWLAPLLTTRHSWNAAALLCRIPSATAVEALLARVDDDLVVDTVLRTLTESGVAHGSSELPAHAVASYLALAEQLAKKAADAPFVRVQRQAAFLASFAGCNDGLARATLGFLARLPATIEHTAELAPFTTLVHASLARFDANELQQLAALLEPSAPALHPLAAAAWAQLESGERLAMAQRLFGDAWGTDHRLAGGEESMTAAMIDALRALDQEALDEALLSFFRTLAASGPPHGRRHALRAPGGATPEMVQQALRRANSEGEFEAALELAASTGTPVGRLTLAKLREPKLQLKPRILELVEKVLGEDDADWIEQEIDGDNPYADRRKALKEILTRLRNR